MNDRLEHGHRPDPNRSGSIRLAVVLSHPIQYYAPWFRHLATGPQLDLRVFYLSDHGLAARPDAQFGRAFAWDTDLLSGYPHEFVPNLARHPNVNSFSGLSNPGLRHALRRFNPDSLLLFGYAYRPHLGLMLRPPAPILFRGDSHLLGGPPPAAGKRLLLRYLFSRCAAFLPVGRANADYFRHFGVPADKLFPAPHCVDAAHFRRDTRNLDTARALRASLRVPDDAPVALFAGKLVPKKCPDLLLAAFIRARVAGAHLVFSGAGELLPALQAAAAGYQNVHFLSFANQSAMPARYLLGDLFVLPSRGRHETWGLAVNESMHLGVPALVSDCVGCQRDLVTDGETGWVFRADDLPHFTEKLSTALVAVRAPGVSAPMRERIAARIGDYSFAKAAAGLMSALSALPLRAPNQAAPASSS